MELHPTHGYKTVINNILWSRRLAGRFTKLDYNIFILIINSFRAE